MNLTILIITKNAQNTLRATLNSLQDWVSSVVIVDDFSTDHTKEIARECGVERVVLYHESNLGLLRRFALSLVHTEWTLVLDSDEVLTAQSRDEILQAIQLNTHDGYFLRLRNHLFGKKLMYGELHKKLILFKTKKATILEREVHEHFTVEGKVGELQVELLHFSYQSVGQMMYKFFDYALRQAREYKKQGKTPTLRELFLNPPHLFFARFIQDGGFKDGFARLILDLFFAGMEFISYAAIPFVSIKKRISVDCGSYGVGAEVRSGIQRILQGLYAEHEKKFDFYWFSFAASSPNKLPARLFSEVFLPIATLINRCDVFLGVSGIIPHLLKYFKVKKILFLYDFGFFEYPEKYGKSASRLAKQTAQSITLADVIVVLHEQLYTEFAVRFPAYLHKVHIIPTGADHLQLLIPQPVFIQKYKPLILAVGVVKPVKQIEQIIDCVGDTYCVIVGAQEQTYKKSLQIHPSQHIQFVQNINDNQLKWLYMQADVMIHTSVSEGFCFPVLEALVSGLPVVAFELPLFKTYQRYFPHLSLVKNNKEMNAELEKNHSKVFPAALSTHPYTWKSFNSSLAALWQTHKLPRPEEPKIAFIVVLFNTDESEVSRLRSELHMIMGDGDEVYWIDNSQNGKGYAAGINEGIRKGLIDSCDLFIALNPDISLEKILRKTILETSGQFDVWGFVMKQNRKMFYGGAIDSWRLSGGLTSLKPKLNYMPVEFVSGSVLGFSKHVVQEIGMWDEDYFMYYEDVDFCLRARKAGFAVGIDSTHQYTHFELSSKNDRKNRWLAKSRWRFFWKYAGLLQKMRECIRLPKTIVGL